MDTANALRNNPNATYIRELQKIDGFFYVVERLEVNGDILDELKSGFKKNEQIRGLQGNILRRQQEIIALELQIIELEAL